jgi:hypothetical protein
MGPGCFGGSTGSSRGAPSRDSKIKTLHLQRPRDRPVRFELRYHAGQVPAVTLDFRSSHFTPMYHATDAIAGCRVTCAVFRDTQMMYLSDKASNYAVRAAQCCTSGVGPPSASHRTASALHHPTYRSCTWRCKTTLDPYVRARGRTEPPPPRTCIAGRHSGF